MKKKKNNLRKITFISKTFCLHMFQQTLFTYCDQECDSEPIYCDISALE